MKDMKRLGEGVRNVIALGFVSFFTDISSEMCFSVLPAFILRLPGASMSVLGLIEGVAEAISYSMRAVSGIFSDAFRRRKVIAIVGYAISNAVKPLFAAAQTAVDALIIRVGDRVGKAVRTSPRDALLSESAPEKRIGTYFGLHRTLDQMGAILGPILASVLMLFLGFTVQQIFLFSFLPGLAALLVLFVLVQERVGKPVGRKRMLTRMGDILTRRFLMLLLVVGVFSIGAFDFSFVLLRARDIGVADALIPFVYAVINVSHTLVAIPAGYLSDRIGKEAALVLGYGTFLASALLLSGTFETPFYAFLIAFVYGAYVGIVETIQRALVPTYAPNELRGTAYGIYYLTVGLSFLVSNTTIGYLWQTFGPSFAFTYSAVTSVAAITGIAIFIKATS